MNMEEFTEYSKTEWTKIQERLDALAKKNCWKAELFKDNCVSSSWSICIRNNNRCVVGGFTIPGYIKLMLVDTATHDEGKFVVGRKSDFKHIVPYTKEWLTEDVIENWKMPETEETK
jgi:hypothetical protein